MMKYLLTGLLITIFASCNNAQDLPHTFWLGKTKGTNPHLEYGLGDDRLGGAKMTFLDTNIILKVVDSVGDSYKVQLSKYHSAYIYKSFVVKDSMLADKPYQLTNKWKVYGDSSNDYISINTSEKLPYTSVQEINPSRIVITIFGVVNNTNKITQLNSAKEIKAAWFEESEDDVMRVYIELKHPQIWGYHIAYDSSGLLIKIRRQKDVLHWKEFKVAIDAGHGGSNIGTAGVTTKIAEKVYTLQYANALQSTLNENGFYTMMTRTKDTNLTMTDRVLMMRDSMPDALISLHFNSDASDTVSGVSTYYRYIGFQSLSKYIYEHLLAIGLNENGVNGSFNFGLNGPTEYPNSLVEIAFLSNPSDEKRIETSSFQKQVAQAITEALKDWLNSNGIRFPKPGFFIK